MKGPGVLISLSNPARRGGSSILFVVRPWLFYFQRIWTLLRPSWSAAGPPAVTNFTSARISKWPMQLPGEDEVGAGGAPQPGQLMDIARTGRRGPARGGRRRAGGVEEAIGPPHRRQRRGEDLPSIMFQRFTITGTRCASGRFDLLRRRRGRPGMSEVKAATPATPTGQVELANAGWPAHCSMSA